MATYGDYFSFKTKVVGNNVEVFVIFIKNDFYEMIKKNNWKNHKIKINQYFIGYNNQFKAMKFNVPVVLINSFVEDLKQVLNAQITIYNISNISYDDFKQMKEKQEKENYEAFMKGLRGEF